MLWVNVVESKYCGLFFNFLFKEKVMQTSNPMDFKNTNGAIPPSIPKDKLMEDLRGVAAHAEELLRSTANQAGDGVAAARARVEENLKAVKERLVAAESALIERSREAAKVTDEYVHDNPWISIGITAAAGIVIGMLIARR